MYPTPTVFDIGYIHGICHSGSCLKFCTLEQSRQLWIKKFTKIQLCKNDIAYRILKFNFMEKHSVSKFSTLSIIKIFTIEHQTISELEKQMLNFWMLNPWKFHNYFFARIDSWACIPLSYFILFYFSLRVMKEHCVLCVPGKNDQRWNRPQKKRKKKVVFFFLLLNENLTPFNTD